MLTNAIYEGGQELNESIATRYPRRSLTSTETLVLQVIGFNNTVLEMRPFLAGNETRSRLLYEIRQLNNPIVQNLCRTALGLSPAVAEAKKTLGELYPYAGKYNDIFSVPRKEEVVISSADLVYCRQYVNEIMELFSQFYVPPPSIECALIWTGYGPSAPAILRARTTTGNRLFTGMTLPEHAQQSLLKFMFDHPVNTVHLSVLREYTINCDFKIMDVLGCPAIEITMGRGFKYVMYPNLV